MHRPPARAKVLFRSNDRSPTATKQGPRLAVRHTPSPFCALATHSPYQPVMLEAFAYRKYKKHKMDKKLREANAREALDPQDEEFIRQSMDKGTTETGSPQGSSASFFKRLVLGKKSSSSGGEAVTPTEEEVVAPTASEGKPTCLSYADGGGNRNGDSRDTGS